ncbi:TolC family protein [Variovorax sp.]|uniref:TolC family protein n=1 Tax=Variovorax sp. TaxID=1871043 RepID=UPI002D66839E|nr:TolC family protein [Variovorax sp.]HYP82150.1 TolC family protein [Variovorax sp.]
MRERHWGFSGVLAAVLMACASTGFAEGSPIKQGFDAAWARQPEQRSAALRRDSAAAGLAAAGRWSPEPPSLELGAKTDRYARNDGGREYAGGIAIPLWLPGERASAQASASSDMSAVDARLLAARWRLAAQVREAFWTVRRADIEQQIAERRLANATRLAQDVARRVSAGDLARADSHQAQAGVAAAQAAVAQAGIGRIQAATAWKALTGLDAARVAESSSPESRPPEALADGQHPALLDLTARVERARAQQALAGVQTRLNPELTLGAVRERDAFGERYQDSIVVGIRVPLGSTSGSAARLAAASADLTEAESELSLEEARIAGQADAARATLHALELTRDAAKRRADLARESRGFFAKSFQLGETDLPTRLRADLEAYEAERQAARSRLDADAAVSSLRQALGLLPD